MNRKILIVDDDLESLKLIGLMLQRRGYDIIVAHSGNQSLDKAQAEKPELIILDVMMPDMDGYEVCRKLRASPDTAGIPVLMFTAKTLVGDKVAGFRAGADDYLTKPIHPSELVAHVEALLQRREQSRSQSQPLPRTRIIGVMGAKGGVGASTLVVNLAAAAVSHKLDAAPEQAAENRVGIVDLRPSLGTIALQLGQMPRGGWVGLLGRSLNNLDAETVNGQIVSHRTGLRYLPAALQPENGQAHLPREFVEAVLERIEESTDVLFLDLGCALDESTRNGIAHCDVLVVVTEPERLSLILTQVLLDKVKDLDSVPADVRVAMVQRFGTDTAYSPADVEKTLGCNLAAVIEPAGFVIRQALEQGEPIVLSHPTSAIAQQLRSFSQSLLAS